MSIVCLLFCYSNETDKAARKGFWDTNTAFEWSGVVTRSVRPYCDTGPLQELLAAAKSVQLSSEHDEKHRRCGAHGARHSG